MSLKGTLDDLGIVDLLQYPHKGRKSGELVIFNGGDEARFYYENGELIHGYSNNEIGLDALVRVVGWKHGNFEFLLGVDSVDRTIEMDLHLALMEALRVHDERKMKEAEEVSQGGEDVAEEAVGILRNFIETSDFALHVSLVDKDGTLLASADRETGTPEDAEPLRVALMELLWSYPRKGVRRAIVEDGDGRVILASLPSGRVLLLLANSQVPVGAICMAANRLGETLEQ